MHFVLVCIDNSVDESGKTILEEIANRFPEAVVVAFPESKQILEQCPVLSVPYLLIIDEHDKVLATNVDVDRVRQITTRLVREPNLGPNN